MRQQRPNSTADVSAANFFNFAREYHNAADELYNLHPECSFSNPIYFLYFHSVELALKAFLRSFNIPIQGTRRKSHKLTELYQECRDLGPKLGPCDLFEIGNVVRMLEAENEYQGLRYESGKPVSMPALSWTRDVVKELMAAVEPYVKAHSEQNPSSTPGAPFKIRKIWGKPQ